MVKNPNYSVLQGHVLDRLRELPDESVQCCVTSPPYWGLRDYGVEGQLGIERTPEEYIAKMVEVFAEVRRVLRDDGTLWLNIGDSYANDGKWGGSTGGKHVTALHGEQIGRMKRNTGLKPKDLVGIPWMLAFALRADGWYLRQDIIWSKPNPMPESVTDRCTKAHEYLFLMSKSQRYFYDADAIAETCVGQNEHDRTGPGYQAPGQTAHTGTRKTKIPGGWDRGEGAHGTIHRDGRTSAEYQTVEVSTTRNKRSVWEVSTQAFPEAHFATFPEKLIEPCILAGSKPGDTVLDPFGGSGTTGVVALRYHRNAILIELNPEYVALGHRRIQGDAPLFNIPMGADSEASA